MAEKVFRTGENGVPEEVQLPEYVCHKHVFAAKIVAVAHLASGTTYRLALEGPAHVDVTRLWVTQKAPVAGGYYVQYGDGYSSYSPAEAFEEGYTLFERVEPASPPVSDEVEQLRVQLAGCSAAALGALDEQAKPGDYGYSASYQDVVDLREKYELLLRSGYAPAASGTEPVAEPSAADLDAVAAEQAITAQTAPGDPAAENEATQPAEPEAVAEAADEGAQTQA